VATLEGCLIVSQNSEECVKRLFDHIGFYVKEPTRVEVLRLLVPYVRNNDIATTTQVVIESIAAWQMNKKVRPGFYKFVDDLRRGNCHASSLYTEEFV